MVGRVATAGLPVGLHITGTPRDLPPGLGLAVYRVVQEALTNVIKHAGKPQTEVRLTYEPAALVVEVADHGRPIPAAGPAPDASVPGGPGMGLLGLRAWLARFAGRDDVGFAIEGCAGWRYVAEELAVAGVAAHLAEPADTALARGRKRHAKTGKTDSRHLRTLLAEGLLPECWIPPVPVLECRALLETYHDLRTQHTAWVQRIHAVLFHQGAPPLGDGTLRTDQGIAALRAAAAAHLSPAGQLQVATALDMLAGLEVRMDMLRCQLRDASAHLTGAKVLAARLYGVGPVTALALTCWLGGAGRFFSSRKAVRFTGLDIIVCSSDGKRSPGRLSRQGRRCCAGRSMSRQDPRPVLGP